MSRKVGRNEPCPCGSGKKYKKCCGLNAPPVHLIPAELRTGTPLDDYTELLQIICAYGQKILRFEKDGPELKRAISRFEKRYRPGKKGGLTDSFYMSWLHFDLRFGPSRETIAERVLRDPLLSTLSEPGPTLVRQMAASYLSFYVVLDPGPEAVIVEELGTGKRFRVRHVRELFEFEPERGEVWYTRLIGPPEQALSYTTPYVFAPLTRAEFERAARLSAKEFLRSPESKSFPADRMFAESQRASALFWAEYIHQGANPARDMLSSVPSTWPGPGPHLVNTDREDIVFTAMHFRIKDEAKLRKRLAALRTFDYDKRDDSWAWLKAQSRLDPEEPRTVLGTFRIKDGCVVAETNSRERAARLEYKFDYHFRGLLVLEKTLYRQQDDPPTMSPEEQEALDKETDELNARPEVREMLRKDKERYYFKKWPRKRVPALGGLTPLQAMKTEKGRAKLERLLDDYDRWQDASPSEVRVDFDALRRMLGLPPKAN